MTYKYEPQHLAFLEEGYKHFPLEDLTREFNRYFR
jgi:hypothetical protein